MVKAYFPEEMHLVVSQIPEFRGSISPGEIENSKKLSCKYAAKMNNLELLKWALNMGCPRDECEIRYAIQNGNLDMVKYIYQTGLKETGLEYGYAAESNKMNIFYWLVDKKFKYKSDSSELACNSGNLGALKIFRSRKFPISDRCAEIVASEGNLKILQWLYDIEIPMKKRTAEFAALNGHLNILIWLSDKLKFGNSVFKAAVSGRNIECLEYLFKQQCFKYDPATINITAINGDIKTFKWLEDKGFPVGEDVFGFAVESGNIELVKYLKFKGYPPSDNIIWLLFHSPFNPNNMNKLEIVTWLVENGYRDNLKITSRILSTNGADVDAVKAYLIKEGIPKEN